MLILLRTWQLGVKSLLLHPLRSLLTVLGIFIGVASVIWLLAISEGISNKAQQQIEDLGATNIIVRSIKPVGETLTDTSFFLQYGLKRSDYDVQVATTPTITRALRIRELKAGAKYGTQEELDVRLVGCTPDYDEVMRLNVAQGHFITPIELDREENHCVLAHGTARHLFPLEEPRGKTILVNDIAFVVVGVMQPRVAMAGIGGSLVRNRIAPRECTARAVGRCPL